MISKREQGFKIWLLISDVVSLSIAFFATLFLRFHLLAHLFAKQGTLAGHIHIFPYLVFIWLAAYYFGGLYDTRLKGAEEFLALVKGVVIGFLLSFAVLFFYREFSYSRVAFVLFGALAVIFGLICRIFFRSLRLHILQKSGSLNKLVIVGYNKIGLSLAEAVQERPIGYEVAGFIDDAFTTETQRTQSEYKILGQIKDLPNIIVSSEISEVWIALTDAPRDKLKQLVEVCLQAKVSFRIVPDLYEVMLEWMRIDSINGIPLIGVKRSNITGLNILIKRLLDIIFSSILIVISAIPMLVIGILIKLTSAGPVFFIQKRVGKNGKRFAFLKFRTMYHNIDRTSHKDYTEKWIEGKTGDKDENRKMIDDSEEPAVHKMTDDPRITPVGRFLRRFSLDELPQFFNVWKGDMSLVGPRPALPYEVEKYQEWHKRRLETKPGITGLWQVSGRNLLPFEEMVKLDIYYIENWSVMLDLGIIFKTAWAMVGRKGY